jgi:hypothetical protein
MNDIQRGNKGTIEIERVMELVDKIMVTSERIGACQVTMRQGLEDHWTNRHEAVVELINLLYGENS